MNRLPSYLKIAFRTLWKYKAQSLTGIFGLAFGLASLLPALYWLRYELSYDSFYPQAEQIYRLYSFDKQTGKTNELVSGILERKLRDQFPALQTATVFFIEANDCQTEETPYIRLRTLFTDSTFLTVFPQTVVSGDRQHPLDVMNNLVLTESMAVRLFGNVEKAVGQQVKSTSLTSDAPYTVTAVVKDPGPHTNLAFDAMLSHEQIQSQKTFAEQSGKEMWTFAFLQMYAKLPPHTDVARLTAQLQNYLRNTYANLPIEIRMLPVGDVRHRLTTDVPFTLNFIRLFAVAGSLLLLSALFNFINLYFNLFRQRMREFRLRAVNGASRSQLIRQMIYEVICALFLAFFPAAVFVALSRPAFSHLAGIPMEIPQLIPLFAVCSLGITGAIGGVCLILFWRLSSLALHPLTESKQTGKAVISDMAVTLQLVVSLVFLVATLVVMMQMRFVNRKDLGFDRNGLIYLSGLPPFIKEDRRVALLEKLASVPYIEKITDTDFRPQHAISPFKTTTNVEWPGKSPSEKPAFHYIATDSEFAPLFRVKMRAGEWLKKGGEPTVVLNEEAVRVMQLSEPVVGTRIRITLRETKEYRIAGVVKDFHTLSLRSRIHPTLFLMSAYPTNNLYIRTIPSMEPEAIREITGLLPYIDASLADVQPTPLGELYDRLNESEQVGLKMFSVLATVCLGISLIGIYAVATAATRRRRKEIAVRKIAGAQASHIVGLFFRNHLRQVLIAGALALPPAYLIMDKWLQGYAYRTNIPWWLLAGVLAGITAVVLLTVLGQVLRAANSNPAEVVKSE